jgi:hypothetical protein
MFQTLLLVVHVLLLTHEFMYNVICLLILGILSVTVHVFYVPKTHRLTDISPSLIFMRLVGPGRCLIVY